MTSLFMGQLLNNPVPAEEKDVRNTATPVNDDKPAAMQQDMPVQSEFESDHDPTLGIGPRQLASKWTEGEHIDNSYALPVVAEVTESTRIINSQVSTSGTAAAREASGQVHKSLSYAVGIEPVGDLQENHRFGEMYFARNQRPIQEGSGNYMSLPPGFDQASILQAGDAGKVNAREATVGSIYAQFLNG